MATSTYSPSLRIELIQPGDQAGTWNTTTNTNLGTIIEAGIAGYVEVPVTAASPAFTQLLTYEDGAPDQARNAVLAFTTGATGNFSVYAPPQDKTYIIYNNSGYTLTIYNSTTLGVASSSGLGVSVATGTKVQVFSDGTNFRSLDVGSFGYASTATAAGTTTLTAASGNYQRFTGVTTQTIVLPVASTLALGASFTIENASTGNLTVNSSGANLVITIIPGVTVTCTCILTSGTTAASWDAEYDQFAAVTGAGAVALVGLTSTATAVGTTTLTATSNSHQRFTGTTTQTIVLPVTSTLIVGTTYTIENASTGNLTVNSSGANLVITIIPGVTVTCTCIGTTLTTALDWDAEYDQFAAVIGAGAVFLKGYTSTATAAGTTTLTVASNNYQRFTGTTTQTIVLPVTSTLTLGASYTIENNSTGNLTVNSSGSNLVITVIPGVTVECTCISITGTTAASWDAEYDQFATITGTGNNVLATSPTLVTPTLGAAAATSLAATGAITGLNVISTNHMLAGTLVDNPVANARLTVDWIPTQEQGITVKATGTTFIGNPIYFLDLNNVVKGYIAQDATSITYNSTSDYRLKNSITPMTGALAKIALLKPCTYKWNLDNSDGQGFIAHELQAVVKECVTGEKDALNEDGSVKSQGVDPSKLVATLTAAIQELKALVDAQAARINALESR